jgi:hypothetical protein
MPSALPTPAMTPAPIPTAKPTATGRAATGPGGAPTPAPRPTPKPAATPARPAAPAVKVGRITYDEDTRFLMVQTSAKATPHYTTLENPPRLVIDLPGTTLAPNTQQFPGALITEVAATQPSPTDARITLTFARPVGQNWAVKQTATTMVFIFDRRPVTE